MKLAYLILAHDCPNHLSRLVSALNYNNTCIFIHVDKKCCINNFENLFSSEDALLIPNRVRVHWGEFSIVKATLNLIAEALTDNNRFDYLILLSGADYPLRSNEYLRDFFAKNSGTQFISLTQMPNKISNKPLTRLEHYRFSTRIDLGFYKGLVNLLNKGIKTIGIKRDYKKALGSLTPFGGGQWWALTKQACDYILNFVQQNPKFVRFFRHANIPDEMFFQTILGNSRFKHRIKDNLTFTDWSNPIPPRPAYINMSHLFNFQTQGAIQSSGAYGSGELLFARKFSDDSQELTRYIDRNLREQ